MKKKSPQDLTDAQIRKLTIAQGRQVSQVLDLPGWEIIENVILLTKANAELERKTKLTAQASRELALYYCGVVDGAEEVRKNIYGVIDAAKEVEKSNDVEHIDS